MKFLILLSAVLVFSELHGAESVSNAAYLMTNNSGGCCLSDNVLHEFCMITTSLDKEFGVTWLIGFESDFELSQCKDRCSNDPFCKGFSKFSISYNDIDINYDSCMLFTTNNDSGFCTHSLDDSLKSTIIGKKFTLTVGQLDPNADCAELQDRSGQLESNYYEGCHIKIKDVKDKCNPNPCQNGGRCEDGECQCPEECIGSKCEICIADFCDDGEKNDWEEDTDCGGPCDACQTCDDGIQNQGETGVDCGGPCTRPCQDACEKFNGIFGIRSEKAVCCNKKCPKCGGEGCGKMKDDKGKKLGVAQCCKWKIIKRGKKCGSKGQEAPCML